MGMRILMLIQNKALDKEISHSIPRESKIGKDVIIRAGFELGIRAFKDVWWSEPLVGERNECSTRLGFLDFGSFMVQKLWKDKAIPTISIDDLQSSLHK
ncbi:hypothetical protein Tco_0368114 [Tanacetum coccineum]